MGRRLLGAELERELETLAGLPRAGLVERWKALHRIAPPKGISTPLMIRAIAYEVQARHYGGLTPAVKRRLDKIAGGQTRGAAESAARAPVLYPGARLVREWNGVTYTVNVTHDGFEWQDQRFGSLSEVAREITGTRWSGPRFFGLNGSAAS